MEQNTRYQVKRRLRIKQNVRIVDEYKKYGQGFKSTTLVGEMYVKEE